MLKNFSIGNKFFAKKKEEEPNNKELEKDAVKVSGVDYSLVKYMNELGNKILTAHNIYGFNRLDQAFFYMLKNQETGLHNHQFCSVSKGNVTSSNICQICGEGVGAHEQEEQIEELDGSQQRLVPGSANDELVKLSKLGSLLKPTNSRKQPSYISVPEEVAKELDDENLCQICFDNYILEKDPTKIIMNASKYKGVYLNCRHKFCEDCITSYLKNKINNRDVVKIKCLYGGCQSEFGEEEIKKFVGLVEFNLYKRFKQEIVFGNNPDIVHCPAPDCQNYVELPVLEDENVLECVSGHVFCYICNKMEVHEHDECPGKEDQILEDLARHSRNDKKFKMCPNCSVIIEKSEGCNHMFCISCGFHFCWLCLREYQEDHYSAYNVLGCPGLRFYDEDKDGYLKSGIATFFYYLGCFLLGVLLVALVLAFFFFFGFAYELINYYLNKLDDKAEGDEEANNRVEPESPNKCIIFSLGLLGLLLQPLYLLFYLIWGFLELVKRCDFWMFYYASY